MIFHGHLLLLRLYFDRPTRRFSRMLNSTTHLTQQKQLLPDDSRSSSAKPLQKIQQVSAKNKPTRIAIKATIYDNGPMIWGEASVSRMSSGATKAESCPAKIAPSTKPARDATRITSPEKAPLPKVTRTSIITVKSNQFIKHDYL